MLVRRDGTELTPASFDTKLPMDPGQHVVIAEAKGFQRVELTFSAVPQTTKEWIIPPLAPEKKVAVQPDEPSGRGRTQQVVGFAMGGTGVNGLVAGFIFVGLTAWRSGDLEELCPNQRCTTQEGKDALAEADRFANAANGLLIAGGALAATGLVLILTAPSDDDVTVTVVPSASGVTVRGGF
jgi:hypothetical protein